MNFSPLPAESIPFIDRGEYTQELLVMGVGALAAGACIVAGAVGVCRIITSKYKGEKDQTNVH